MKSEHEQLDLIRRCIDGDASDADRQALQEQLRSGPAVRRLYARYANIDATLGTGGIALTAPTVQPQRSKPTWLFWRPLYAAAAGLVIGLFSASLVFGFGLQLQSRIQTLLSESFEDVNMPLERGVPRRTEVWSGDLLAAESGAVKAAEGQRMMALPPMQKRIYSYAFRFLDLTRNSPKGAAESCQIEVMARFHSAAAGKRDRYQIRLAAFAEDAEVARELWIGNLLNEMALTHVVKTVKMKPDAEGWATVRTLIDVPAGARLLLIALGAGHPDDPQVSTPEGGHFLDDVQVRLITQETLR